MKIRYIAVLCILIFAIFNVKDINAAEQDLEQDHKMENEENYFEDEILVDTIQRISEDPEDQTDNNDENVVYEDPEDQTETDEDMNENNNFYVMVIFGFGLLAGLWVGNIMTGFLK